jgi:hypothetical protein
MAGSSHSSTTVTPWTTASTAGRPDGQVGTLELWQRDGADPVELLSAWEREQLERLLAGL